MGFQCSYEQAYVCTASCLFSCALAEGFFSTCREKIPCPPITKHLLPELCGERVHGRRATSVDQNSNQFILHQFIYVVITVSPLSAPNDVDSQI
ncbi:hypothetical protein BDV37DRAFT_126441 [Aspergillus pseudonomiae]|uniref:Uncharacterized protein n=1 Tax=Aspergillus pseudonomiae TaxID=1506151 RepID=A0A5N7DB82_9EURO|nr:uncharacterized protein BDV37DRAFT_126441 [Aspergillus pseudonomiae]KAE8403720.1 hypothetical protein BDV37DRAFT_126441 [Aspergillus pseudonomiae]